MTKIDEHTGRTFWNYGRLTSGNTVVRQDINTMRVFLCGHPIVTLNGAGQLTLNTCGYKTRTTKARMNAVLNRTKAFVFQKDYEWYIEDRWNNATYKFEGDEIVLQLTEHNRHIAFVR